MSQAHMLLFCVTQACGEFCWHVLHKRLNIIHNTVDNTVILTTKCLQSEAYSKGHVKETLSAYNNSLQLATAKGLVGHETRSNKMENIHLLLR